MARRRLPPRPPLGPLRPLRPLRPPLKGAFSGGVFRCASRCQLPTANVLGDAQPVDENDPNQGTSIGILARKISIVSKKKKKESETRQFYGPQLTSLRRGCVCGSVQTRQWCQSVSSSSPARLQVSRSPGLQVPRSPSCPSYRGTTVPNVPYTGHPPSTTPQLLAPSITTRHHAPWHHYAHACPR